jgi:hypothetical protein
MRTRMRGQWRLVEVLLSDVRERVGVLDTDEHRVELYAQRLRDGERNYPPFIVAYDQQRTRSVCLLDGRHRLLAAEAAGEQTVRCYVPESMMQGDAVAWHWYRRRERTRSR